MANGERVFLDPSVAVQEYAKEHGIHLVQSHPIRSPLDISELLKLPLQEQFHLAAEHRNRNSQKSHRFTDFAIRSALEQGHGRQKVPVRVFAPLPAGFFDGDKEPGLTYPIYAILRERSGKKDGYNWLTTTRFRLAHTFSPERILATDLKSADEIVYSGAEILTEQQWEEYNRLVAQLKLQDGQISLQKPLGSNTNLTEELNRKKCELLLAIFRKARMLEAQFPDLAPLLTADTNMYDRWWHIGLQLSKIKGDILERVIHPNKPIILRKDTGFSTVTNKSALMTQRILYQEGNSQHMIADELLALLDMLPQAPF